MQNTANIQNISYSRAGILLEGNPEWLNLDKPLQARIQEFHKGDKIEYNLKNPKTISDIAMVEKNTNTPLDRFFKPFTQSNNKGYNSEDRGKEHRIIRMNCLSHATNLVTSGRLDMGELLNKSKELEDYVWTSKPE